MEMGGGEMAAQRGWNLFGFIDQIPALFWPLLCKTDDEKWMPEIGCHVFLFGLFVSFHRLVFFTAQFHQREPPKRAAKYHAFEVVTQ